MRYILFLVLVSASLLLYSFTLEQYSDSVLFQSEYSKMRSGQSEEYYELRDSMLTPKYRLQDTGIMLLTLSFMISAFLLTGKGQINSPRRRYVYVLFAILLPFLSSFMYVFDLFQGQARGEFPHWADSLGIPLMSTPFLFLLSMVFSLLHLFFLKSVAVKLVSLVKGFSMRINPWILFVSLVNILLAVLEAIYGHYWNVIPSLLWVYYFYSLGVNRYYAKIQIGDITSESRQSGAENQVAVET